MNPAEPPPTLRQRKRGNYARNIAGVVVSGLCIGFMAWRIDFAGAKSAITNFDVSYLAWGVLSLSLGYSARILRWSTMLRAAGADTSPMKCAAPFLGSIALNNVLPARLGDVVRAFVFPSALGISRIVSTGTLVMERLADLATLLLFLLIGLVAYPTARLPESVKLSAIVLSVGAVVALLAIFVFSGPLSSFCFGLARRDFGKHNTIARRLLTGCAALLATFRAMSRPSVLIGIFALSLLAWAGESGLFLAFLKGFGISATPASAAIVMTMATLATLVPSSPGYVGPFHLAAYTAMTLLGSSADVAASFAVLTHAGIWMSTTFAGGLAILSNPGLFGGRRLEFANGSSGFQVDAGADFGGSAPRPRPDATA